MKSVLSYTEYLLEKKAVNQDLSKGAPAKGSAAKKMVDAKMADLPKGKGSASKKMVDSKTSNVVVKGKAISKMVNPGLVNGTK